MGGGGSSASESVGMEQPQYPEGFGTMDMLNTRSNDGLNITGMLKEPMFQGVMQNTPKTVIETNGIYGDRDQEILGAIDQSYMPNLSYVLGGTGQGYNFVPRVSEPQQYTMNDGRQIYHTNTGYSRRGYRRFSRNRNQRTYLNQVFQSVPNPNQQQISLISQRLGVSPMRVANFFRNKRSGRY